MSRSVSFPLSVLFQSSTLTFFLHYYRELLLSFSVFPISSFLPFVISLRLPRLHHCPQPSFSVLTLLAQQVMKELKKPGVLTKGARAISAIKGIEVDLKSIDIYTYPSIIEKELNLPCSALGGANIALEVANEEFCETT